MTRKFGESKYANKYLEDRYGKIYKLTFDCNEELQKSIILDHDKDQLKRMLKRVEATINVEKDTQTLFSQPYSIILVMITVMMSAGMAMISNLMSIMSNIFGRFLDSKDVKKINFDELFNSIGDFTSVIEYALLIAFFPFLALIIYWYFSVKRNKKIIEKRYVLLILLRESLENYDVVKQQIKQEELIESNL
ncbi:hypothetical protein [Bacillus altitudinis]|uniref:hypothetical protein n=1 Tax=Bacillus altitudinis TaxID=293387 RepID=UPI00228153CB|nr:hypothetical protein [Bacillus altitudinis]MCY7449239.1 hypothetical protein [Bacillus altitudinis]MCY7453755.1 hypothetical protein [Bacillus altitudinis]MCY7530698.1 hypothetical protein [Bacillus altitudinis]